MWEGSAQKSSILSEKSQALNFGVSQNASKDGEINSLIAVYGGTELMYFRARYYSGELGRFVSRDPLGTALDVNWMNFLNMLEAGAAYIDGMSLYGAYFVVNGLDPSGLCECDGLKETAQGHDAQIEATNETLSAVNDEVIKIIGDLYEGLREMNRKIKIAQIALIALCAAGDGAPGESGMCASARKALQGLVKEQAAIRKQMKDVRKPISILEDLLKDLRKKQQKAWGEWMDCRDYQRRSNY
jgi:hypothetical protein